MQKSNYEFMRICARHLSVSDPVYEFGSYRVESRADEDLRPLFAGKAYIGADMRLGPGVDKVLDLHQLDLPDASVGFVISLDTLEHVEFPRKAMAEIYRILRPDGIAIISSVFEFPIHNYPNDYWRFTPEGFRSLLQAFQHREIFSMGVSDTRPQNILGIGFKGEPPELSEFRKEAENWSKWYSAILQEMIRRKSEVQ